MTNPSPPSQPPPGGMTYADVENTWIKAGGNPQAAGMAAAIADASSGLNPGATFTQEDGSIARGLWLINSTFGALSTTDPIANARAAIQLSNNGTDWSNWCVAWSDNDCGNSGGTYLGDGSNALGSYAQKYGKASYNVAGAQVAGNGTSFNQAIASNAAQSAVPSTSSGALGKYGPIIAGIGVIAFLIYLIQHEHKRGKKADGGS